MISHDHWFEDCAEHDDCTVHVSETVNEQTHLRDDEAGVPRGTHKVIQHSHMHSSVDPAFRMNLDYPDCEDRRKGAKKGARVKWKLADDDALASEHFSWDEQERRRVAFIAAGKGLGKLEDLAKAANTDHVSLAAEAKRKRWS